jgi:DNA modification methylase
MDDVIVVESDGTKLVAVKRTDLDLEADGGKARALATYDNRAGQLDLDWDIDALSAVDTDVLKDLWTVDELDELGIIEKPQGDAEPQIDRAAELQEKWQVKTGDLWQIGDHRLLCGDSTKRDDVEKVMQGEKAQLFVTDPPYGVSYADKNKFLNTISRANHIETPIENDHQTVPEMGDLWLGAFSVIYEYCDDGCPYYIFSPQGGDLMMMMMMMIQKAGWQLKHSIIWIKQQFVLGRSDYHYKHEPILYGWKKGGHKFYGNPGECSVWEVDKPHISDLHPTTKPLELCEHAIGNSSAMGEIVIDNFVGSGTTIVACQNLGRKCRAIEISPKYCAVTLERMATAFPGIEIERM